MKEKRVLVLANDDKWIKILRKTFKKNNLSAQLKFMTLFNFAFLYTSSFPVTTGVMKNSHYDYKSSILYDGVVIMLGINAHIGTLKASYDEVYYDDLEYILPSQQQMIKKMNEIVSCYPIDVLTKEISKKDSF